MGESEVGGQPGAPSERVKVLRGAGRARYAREDVLGILDAGLIAHVGVSTSDGPLVLEMPLTEASAKVRSGDPIDEPEDIIGPWWAGVVPVITRFGSPRASADFTGDSGPPAPVTALSGLTPDERPTLA